VAFSAIFKKLGYRGRKAVKKLFINNTTEVNEERLGVICRSYESSSIMCWGQAYVTGATRKAERKEVCYLEETTFD
jgi:glycerol kinase